MLPQLDNAEVRAQPRIGLGIETAAMITAAGMRNETAMEAQSDLVKREGMARSVLAGVYQIGTPLWRRPKSLVESQSLGKCTNHAPDSHGAEEQRRNKSL